MDQEQVSEKSEKSSTSTPNSSAPPLPEEMYSEDQEHAPRRGKRKLLLDDGEGDYRVFLVHPGGPAAFVEGNPDCPKGALLPLRGYPGFNCVKDAERYITSNASQVNSMLSGQALAIVRFSAILKLEVAQAIHVTMAKKPRRVVDATAAPE